MSAFELVATTTTTSPVANTTAGLYTFTPPASRVRVINRSGTTVYLRFNSSSAASLTTHDHLVGADCSELLAASRVGTAFSTISVWFETGADVSKFLLRGL